MRLKWKLRLYYGALVLVLLALVGAATAALVLHGFKQASAWRETAIARSVRRMLKERLAEIDSSVAKAAADPDLFVLAKRDFQTSHELTQREWVPLAATLSQRYGLPLL